MEVLVWGGTAVMLAASGLLIWFLKRSVKWGVGLVLLAVALVAFVLLLPDSCAGELIEATFQPVVAPTTPQTL